MSVVEVQPDAVVVRLNRFEKAVTLRRRDVRVPYAHVERAYAVHDPWPILRGLRLPGLGLPSVAAVGTWVWRRGGDRGKDFYVVRGHGPAVVLDLVDEPFRRIVLSVDDPREVLRGL